MTVPQRRQLARLLKQGWPDEAADLYHDVCHVVSQASATVLQSQITSKTGETLTWRLLRIGSAPYFVLGSSRTGSMRLRIVTPWEFRQRCDLQNLEVQPEIKRQPRSRTTVRGCQDHLDLWLLR